MRRVSYSAVIIRQSSKKYHTECPDPGTSRLLHESSMNNATKTSLPHFTGRLQKGVDPSSLLKTLIQGVLNHGRKTFDTYVDLNEYCHDSNLIMNVLLRTVHDSIGKNGKLPEILYNQADNCGRENKNMFMLGLFDLLVRLAGFREVHLSFLNVGHTHEDIDAAFSRIAEKLRTEDAETLPKLLHVLQGGRKLQGLFDIKQWMEPHINQIKHHSKPLHFLFSKDAEGDVCVLYKGNSRRPWKRLECTILNNVPVGKPVVLLPSKVNKINISAIRSNVERCRYRMSGGDGQYQWWVRFLNEMSEISQSQQRMKEYASAQAYWLLPNLKNKVFLHSSRNKCGRTSTRNGG